uniref:(California timema) hypothetical protein n=1 Tax=Timema californicum TaxID=61474 RepID=A0A7R9P6S0_TIMCA|nr:unnamed protein product [Timema californicum]
MLTVMTSRQKMAVMVYDAPNEKIRTRPAGDLREVCPIYWAHDTAMQLYPLPDLVVVADQFNAFTASYMDCIVTNPVRKFLFFFISMNTPFTM